MTLEEALARIVTDENLLKNPCRRVLPEEQTKADLIVQDLLNCAQILDTGKELKCLGLAANQLGYDLRICVVKINGYFRPFVNPEILEKAKPFNSYETCFSRPNKPSIKVRRFKLIKIQDNTRHQKNLSHIEAVAFQHELDHLDGVLI